MASGEEHFQQLLQALREGEPWNRRANAASALGYLENPRAFEPLLAALDDPCTLVRAQALLALAELRDRRALGPLLATLAYAHANPLEVWAFEAVYGLAALGGKQAIDAVLGAAQHPSLAMRLRVFRVLGERKIKRAVPLLIAALQDNPEPFGRQAAASALQQIGDPAAIEPLIAALEDPANRRIAVYLLSALGYFGDPRAVPVILDQLQSESTDTVCFAARALGQIGDGRAVAPLLGLLEHGQTGQPAWVRPFAAEALGRLGDDRAFAPLLDALHDEDADLRVAAAEGLGHLGDSRALPALQHAQRDPGYTEEGLTVKRAARQAIRQIKRANPSPAP